MNLKQLVAQGSIAGVLAVSAIGAAPAVSADPDWEDWGNDEWVDNDWHGDQWRFDNDRFDNGRFDNGRFDNDWEWKNWNNNDWDKWWRVNRWRNDDRPPWGWGAPPPVQWRGHIPHDFDYWGFRVFPFWHPHFKVFGFWLFGIFIPVFII
jgi:hypothetical protein